MWLFRQKEGRSQRPGVCGVAAMSRNLPGQGTMDQTIRSSCHLGFTSAWPKEEARDALTAL